MRRFTQDPEDKILWALTSTGGKADRTYLLRRLDMTLAELEPALAALGSKNKIKRDDFEEKGKTNALNPDSGIWLGLKAIIAGPFSLPAKKGMRG